MVLHRLEGDAVFRRAARHRVHVLEIKAQLVYRTQLQCRNRNIRFTVQQPLQHRQAKHQAVRILRALQAEGLQELVVQADIHARAVFGGWRGIAVVQIDINAVGTQQVQIRRQIQRQANRRWLKPRRLQLFFIGFQLAKGDRTVGTHPVWRIIRFTRQQRLDLIYHDAVAAEKDVALGNGFCCLHQIFIITTKDHQQLHVRVFRVAYHLNGRRVDVRMIAQEGRTFCIGGKHNGISVRQFVIHRREALTAPARA